MMASTGLAVLENDLNSPQRPRSSQPPGGPKLKFEPAAKRREGRKAALEKRKLKAEKLKEEVHNLPQTPLENFHSPQCFTSRETVILEKDVM
jgi:hypothetical protein